MINYRIRILRLIDLLFPLYFISSKRRKYISRPTHTEYNSGVINEIKLNNAIFMYQEYISFFVAIKNKKRQRKSQKS